MRFLNLCLYPSNQSWILDLIDGMIPTFTNFFITLLITAQYLVQIGFKLYPRKCPILPKMHRSYRKIIMKRHFYNIYIFCLFGHDTVFNYQRFLSFMDFAFDPRSSNIERLWRIVKNGKLFINVRKLHSASFYTLSGDQFCGTYLFAWFDFLQTALQRLEKPKPETSGSGTENAGVKQLYISILLFLKLKILC